MASKLVFEQMSDFIVFPNPTQHELYVVLKDDVGKSAQLQIYNRLGQLQLEKTIESLPDQAIRFHLEGLMGGLYFLQVHIDGQSSQTKRFMVGQFEQWRPRN